MIKGVGSMTAEAKQKKTITSVIKALDVIDCLSQSEMELSVTEISEVLNMGVSGTYHVLNTLKECGYVEQNSRSKKYKLGIKLWQIGMNAYNQNQISLVLRPYLVKLRDLTGETANLTILDNDHIVYICQVESTKPIKMFTRIGASAPLHCTGAGKILLAYQNEESIREIISRIDMKKYTENTITNKSDLIRKLDEIRSKGYGYDEEERNVDVFCIGAPVFDVNMNIMACISISGPKSRFSEENIEKWTEIVVTVAKEATGFLRGK